MPTVAALGAEATWATVYDAHRLVADGMRGCHSVGSAGNSSINERQSRF